MTDEQPKSAPAPDDEVSIVYPINRLASKVRTACGTLQDLLSNAETMMSNLKEDFEGLTDQTVTQLPIVYSQQWQNESTRPDAVITFKKIAHALKGRSGSFGFGLLGEVADLFRDYLQAVPAADQKPEALQAYINALQIVWTQRISGDGGKVGRQIVADLTKLNEKTGSPSRPIKSAP